MFNVLNKPKYTSSFISIRHCQDCQHCLLYKINYPTLEPKKLLKWLSKHKKHQISNPTSAFYCNKRMKILWSIIVDQQLFSRDLLSKNVSGNAQWNCKGEVISHLPPLCSVVLENSNPCSEYCHP